MACARLVPYWVLCHLPTLLFVWRHLQVAPVHSGLSGRRLAEAFLAPPPTLGAVFCGGIGDRLGICTWDHFGLRMRHCLFVLVS